MSTQKINAKLALMVQPGEMRSEEYLPWSGGRGVDVWAMLIAAITGDLGTIKKLVAHDPKLVSCSYQYLTPLHFAVRENHRAVIDFLLEKEVDPAHQPFNNLLEMARDRGYNEIVELFESKMKARYNISREGAAFAPLFKSFDKAGVRELLKKQPELLHAADENGNQPIHWAVMTRQLDLIDELVKLGADINSVRPDGARPLDLTNGDYGYRGWRDLPLVKRIKHEVVLGYLLAHGAYLDISTAAKIGHLERVKELLDKDPSLVNNLPVYYGYYSGLPLRCAAGAGHIEIVKLLLARGANPNEPEPGIAPHGASLHAAIGAGHTAIVKLLLEHGANPNAAVESSGNCFWMAKHIGSKEIADLVASYGGAGNADLVCYDGDVQTMTNMFFANPQLEVAGSIHNVIDNGHQQLMELILRHQPDIFSRPIPNPSWGSGMPPTAEYARWLMEKGWNPNSRNWVGTALLHRCARNGRIDIAAVALDFGADINITETEYSSTPLGWAAREGKNEMVKWLLEKGANPNLPADEPWALPIEWAKRRGHSEIVEILK